MTPDKKISIRRQLSAIAALLLMASAVVLLVVVQIHDFPLGLVVLGGLLIALAAAWFGARRRGGGRMLGFAIAAIALAVGFGAQFAGGHLLIDAAIIVTFALALVFGGQALRFRKRLPPATPPQHPVLFMNPWSGGGKARRFALADEAKKRGIDSVELKKGDDLETLVRDAVTGGADGLAMAGGDGSQAIVAAIAAELDLPYACIPAGTRNHLALDLGVDRNDVVGALDAFVDGGERRVDLAELNGSVFVNNVSLGVYAEAVQRKEYRGAKLRTLLDTIPDALGDEGESVSLRWPGPDGETRDAGAAVILVSNNSYRLGRAISSGTRPRLDAGVLGIAAFDTTHTPPKAIEWTAKSFEVGADRPVPAGIDGEAAMIDPPLRFGIRPGALRARIAPSHPGVSPSAGLPDGFGEILVLVCKIAAGRS